VNELKEAFEFFDHDKDGSLSKDDIKKAVKELGVDGDVDEMFKEASAGSGSVTFPAFMSMMSSRLMQVDTADNLTGAFKIFDPDTTGYIDSDKLREKLTSLGEPLTASEWQEFKACCVQGGKADYMVFVNTLFSTKM